MPINVTQDPVEFLKRQLKQALLNCEGEKDRIIDLSIALRL